MAPIEVSIEVDRSQEAVFAYVTDPSRFVEWQAGVVGGRMDDGEATTVGAKCMTTRRIGAAEREVTSKVTRPDPPHAWAVHGIDGPIRDEMPANLQRLKERLENRAHGAG